MAEWSKAPDSSSASRPGVSGLQVEAWVRIPLLTHIFFPSLFFPAGMGSPQVSSWPPAGTLGSSPANTLAAQRGASRARTLDRQKLRVGGPGPPALSSRSRRRLGSGSRRWRPGGQESPLLSGSGRHGHPRGHAEPPQVTRRPKGGQARGLQNSGRRSTRIDRFPKDSALPRGGVDIRERLAAETGGRGREPGTRPSGDSFNCERGRGRAPPHPELLLPRPRPSRGLTRGPESGSELSTPGVTLPRVLLPGRHNLPSRAFCPLKARRVHSEVSSTARGRPRGPSLPSGRPALPRTGVFAAWGPVVIYESFYTTH
ncbi:uncharacterized protein LOC101725391 [Heterocephalus glaber]|uniref:Uncharacterized protein LOC101725391 n=1 Tax=Heterocephalus glaber TaxID=10181 RepID=A0AAX6T2I6_HETGA|nr:uncharacterized protein LOC101725391 [Heterocephalus glaber]XP_021116471.1 uncharacterized protein LOC101725391 [Heterocephalus glaber]XP_021116472.1 uncharacterized protein LOC101725391 [Heterocephalus glaber]